MPAGSDALAQHAALGVEPAEETAESVDPPEMLPLAPFSRECLRQRTSSVPICGEEDEAASRHGLHRVVRSRRQGGGEQQSASSWRGGHGGEQSTARQGQAWCLSSSMVSVTGSSAAWEIRVPRVPTRTGTAPHAATDEADNRYNMSCQ